ncbi:PrsW family glutamic-type intramembrane protease [Ferruginibacter sp.]
MGLLALAVAPGIAICLFIYAKDKYNKEPLWLILVSFILGALSIVPALISEVGFTDLLKMYMVENTPAYIAVFSFGVVACSEELSKFLVVRFFCFRRKAFDDPFDGIVYSVIVSMGFATLENIGYVYEHGIAVGVTRMFLSVPAHATFGVLMGYHVGLAKFNTAKRGRYLLMGLLWAIVFHGTFDFFLFLSNNLLHLAGALGSFIVAIYLSRRAIRKKQAISKQYLDGLDVISNNDNSLL